MNAVRSTKTIVVLGAAYGGARAAQLLAAGVPDGWRVIAIDRNSHANHVYVMPRYSVLPGHEHKAFIPFRNVFHEKTGPPHLFLQAHVLSMDAHSVTLSKSFPEHGIPTQKLAFDYAVYALGSHLPSPLDLWAPERDEHLIAEHLKKKDRTYVVYKGEKKEGIDWLKDSQKLVEDSPSVLVVGGGALGIQFATDIAAVYPQKRVTLLHSRNRLLPRFDEAMHTEILETLQKTDIDVILGERLDLQSISKDTVNESGQRVVKTVTGREVAADLLLLCTGQKPNTGILKDMDPLTLDPNTSLIHVLRTLQIARLPSGDTSSTEEAAKPYPHIFAIGDAADAFGAIAAGHTAYRQGEVAANNIVRLIKRAEKVQPTDEVEELEEYSPGPPGIKVSLGLTKAVYQINGTVGVLTDGKPDLQAALIWPFFGIKVEKDDDMYE
ncbi:hypothetical protein AX16_009829 [Volvariella volvacea WC 439]|nr:hypothetical protein AX16_009829 [Volvariella volvacea WC 439]